MEIGSAYSASGLWDLNALNGVDSSSQKSSSTGQSGSSGDTVDISDEARKLFSEKIHQYDKGSSTTATADANQNSGGEETEASEAQGGGASGGSGGASDVSIPLLPEIVLCGIHWFFGCIRPCRAWRC